MRICHLLLQHEAISYAQLNQASAYSHVSLFTASLCAQNHPCGAFKTICANMRFCHLMLSC